MAIIAAVMVPHPPIIIPKIGKGEEKKISETTKAYQQAMKFIASYSPETIIISSPHALSYFDYLNISNSPELSGSLYRFGDNERFTLETDEELLKEIVNLCEKENFQGGTEGQQDPDISGDHGTLIPIYFLNQELKHYKVIHLGISGLSEIQHYHFGMLIEQACEKLNRKAAYIASGDLSHCQKAGGPYGYKECGPQYDSKIMDIMDKAEFNQLFSFSEEELEKAEVCGHKSFTIMAGAFNGRNVEARYLSHEATFGVGYGVVTFKAGKEDINRDFYSPELIRRNNEYQKQLKKEDAYVHLARMSLETYVKTGMVIKPEEDLPAEMLNTKAGCFVSLHKDGQLRGCIGTIEATRKNLALEIIHNAISASTRDPRFNPVNPSELSSLKISVDVLGETEEITDLTKLNVKKYGVIVTKGMRRGLLLPNLDGVDTIEQQLEIAKQKAGLDPQEEDCTYQRFEVVRHL